MAHRIAPAALALAAASALMSVAPANLALSATQGGAVMRDQVKGWPAVAGLSGREVLTLARTLPATPEVDPAKPWCDTAASVDRQLDDQFAESLITRGSEGTQLWGSPLMGTWTVVLARPDQTSCIIASGIGFEEGANPAIYFGRVGLPG